MKTGYTTVMAVILGLLATSWLANQTSAQTATETYNRAMQEYQQQQAEYRKQQTNYAGVLARYQQQQAEYAETMKHYEEALARFQQQQAEYQKQHAEIINHFSILMAINLIATGGLLLAIIRMARMGASK
jgi:Skp family chaperone for outer membrane proteins